MLLIKYNYFQLLKSINIKFVPLNSKEVYFFDIINIFTPNIKLFLLISIRTLAKIDYSLYIFENSLLFN